MPYYTLHSCALSGALVFLNLAYLSGALVFLNSVHQVSEDNEPNSCLFRMEGILASKLAGQSVPALPVTCLSFIRAMWEVKRQRDFFCKT